MLLLAIGWGLLWLVHVLLCLHRTSHPQAPPRIPPCSTVPPLLTCQQQIQQRAMGGGGEGKGGRERDKEA